MRSGTTSVINELVSNGWISIADAEFISVTRMMLDEADASNSRMIALWDTLSEAERGAWLRDTIAREAALLEGFKERWGASKGRELWKVIDY